MIYEYKLSFLSFSLNIKKNTIFNRNYLHILNYIQSFDICRRQYLVFLCSGRLTQRYRIDSTILWLRPQTPSKWSPHQNPLNLANIGNRQTDTRAVGRHGQDTSACECPHNWC